jgi:hypothetical protein
MASATLVASSETVCSGADSVSCDTTERQFTPRTASAIVPDIPVDEEEAGRGGEGVGGGGCSLLPMFSCLLYLLLVLGILVGFLWWPPSEALYRCRFLFGRSWNVKNDRCIESTVGLLFFVLKARLIRVVMFFLDPFVRLVVHFAHLLARGGDLIDCGADDGCERGNSVVVSW